MKARRDLVQEILSIRTRSVGVPRDIALSHRLRLLDSALEAALSLQDLNARTELIRYIPIGTVTCIEGYLRSIFRDLIDYGAPYADNAAGFNNISDIKLDWRMARAIHGKTVSVGDFLSHILPVNSLQDVKTNMGVLLKADFLENLKDVEVYQFINGKQRITKVRPVIGDIISALNAIFEERHIYCHELALRTKADPASIKRNYEFTKLFLLATEAFIRSLLSEWKGLTSQVEMNQKASKEFHMIDEELGQLVERYSTDEKTKDKGLSTVQKVWEQFREASAEYLASGWEGGSGWSLVYCSHKTEITRRRVEEIRKEHQFDESLAELDSLSVSEIPDA